MGWLPFDKVKEKSKGKILEGFFKDLEKTIPSKILNTQVYFPSDYNYSNPKNQLKFKISYLLKMNEIVSSSSPLKILRELNSRDKKISIDGYPVSIKVKMTGGNRGSGLLEYEGETKKNPTNNQRELATIYSLENPKATIYEIREKFKFNFDDTWSWHFEASKKLLDYTIKSKKIFTSKTKIIHDATSPIAKELFSICRKIGFTDSKDNWNPADFWIFNEDKNKIFNKLKNCSNIYEFNDEIKKLFYECDLIGISLKKIPVNSSAKIEIIDPSKRDPVDIVFDEIEYKEGNTNFFVKDKNGFIIRVGFKTSEPRVYYEGRMKNENVQLGGISKKEISKIIKDITGKSIEKIEEDKKLSREEIISKIVEIFRECISKDKDFLKECYYLSMKQSKKSSIYLKLH